MEKTIILKEKKEVVRQELNIEKWPLFAPSTFRGKSREIKREVVLENGDKLIRKVIIGKVNESEVDVLRITDYKVFNVLVKLWEEAGKPISERIPCSLYNISNSLKTTGGGRNYKELHRALGRLRGILITWEESFYCKETNTTEKLVTYFNLLEDLYIFERKREKKNQLYFTFSSFKLNYRIINNLLHNYSKPLYLDIILKFKKEISVLLYRHIDLVMADKNYYERTTEGLFNDLDLNEYKYPSQRKRLLEPVLEELEGVELTTGVLSQARLEKTTDGKDWKVVFRKSRKGLKIKSENNKVVLALELFNKRFPQKKGMLKEEVIEVLIKKYSLDKVMLHISRISNGAEVNNPVGLLRMSLEKEWDLPPKQEEIQLQEKQARDEKEQIDRARQQKEREEYQKTKEEEERLNKIFFSLSPDEQEKLKEEARQEIIAEHMEDSQEKTSKFFLMDIMVMIKAREILRKQESLK